MIEQIHQEVRPSLSIWIDYVYNPNPFRLEILPTRIIEGTHSELRAIATIRCITTWYKFKWCVEDWQILFEHRSRCIFNRRQTGFSSSGELFPWFRYICSWVMEFCLLFGSRKSEWCNQLIRKQTYSWLSQMIILTMNSISKRWTITVFCKNERTDSFRSNQRVVFAPIYQLTNQKNIFLANWALFCVCLSVRNSLQYPTVYLCVYKNALSPYI
jgi:hypothetical protein